MATLEGGSLYYTVSIDRASLQRAIKDVRALGDAVNKSNGQAQEGTSVLRRMAQEAALLANRVTQLKADFDSNKISNDEMVQGLRAVQQASRGLRSELETTGAASIETAGDASYFQSVMTRVASVMKQTSAVTAQSEGDMDMLGNSFQRLTNDIQRLGIDMRSLRNRFEAGELGIEDYTAQMRNLIEYNRRYEAELKSLGGSLNLSNKQMKTYASSMGQVTRNMKAGEQAITRATGKFQSMAVAQQLSYGATTLLNDRIFQLSPALGILTNQLIFTTNGMKAFLVSAAPIVAVAGTLIGLIGGLVVSLRSGTGLEAALASVRKTTNLTDGQLMDLTDTFQELAEDIPITTRELLDISAIAGQLGIRGVRNIAEFSETIAQLSIATNVMGEEGATSLARFLQALGTESARFGIEAKRVGNILNELENNTAATADEILQMTSYTQGLSSQAGFTSDEILGLNAALLSLGVKAEAGGSAVVRTVGKIQQAGTDGGAALTRFAQAAGVTVDEFRDMARNSPVDALVLLAQGMKNIADNGGNLNDVLNQLGINEVRERRAMLALAQGADTLSEAMGTAAEQAVTMDSLIAEVGIQSETVEAKLVRLGNRFRTIGQDVGTFLLPALHALLDVLIAMADNLEIVVPLLIALTGAILQVTGALGIFLRGVRGVVSVLGVLAGPLGLLAAVTTGFIAFSTWLSNSADESGRAEREFGEFQDTVDDAQTLFQGVRDKNDLVVALDAISETLTGDAKDAWVTYKDQIIAAIGEVENLEDAIDSAMGKLGDILTAPLEARVAASRANLIQSLNDAYSDLQDVNPGLASEIRGMDYSPEGIQQTLETLRLIKQQILNSREAGATSQLAPALLGDVIEDVEALARAEVALDAAQRSAARSAEELREARTPPGGEEPPPFGEDGDKSPVADIMARLQAQEAVLEYKFFELGEISAEEYFNGLKAAQTQARDALLPIMLVPGEFADAARNAFGIVDNSLTNTLTSLRDGAEAAVDQVRAAKIALDRLYPGYGTPREVGGAEGAARDRAREQRIAQGRARSAGMIADQQRELANELARLRGEQAEEEEYWERRRVRMRERTSRLVSDIVENEVNETTREIERERELQERNDQYWESRAERMRERNRLRIQEGERLLDLRLRELELLDEQERRERAIAQSQQANAAVARLFPGAVGEADAEKQLEDARKVGKANREYIEDMEEIEEMLSVGFIDAHEAAEMRVRALTRRIEAIAEVTGYATPEIAAMVDELKEFEKLKPRDLVKPEPGADVSKSSLQVFSEILGDIGDQVPGVAGEIASALSTIVEGTDQIFLGFAMMADGSENSTETIVKGVSSIANGLLALLPVQESLANQMVEGFFSAAGAMAEFATGIPGLGAAISAVGSVFSRILGDMSNGLRQIREQIDEFVAGSDYLNEALVETFADMATETVSRGNFLGWLGFTKQQLDEELFDLLTGIATGLANGIAGAINQGIKDGLAGGDWEDNLKKNLSKAIVEAVIQSFIQTAILEGVFNKFFLTMTEMIANGNIRGALEFAAEMFPQYLEIAEGIIDDFVEMIPPEFREALGGDDSGGGGGGSAGTNIGQITGPTRDLLLDLFRPLAILPSWTSMIRDIRNDVRKLAGGADEIAVPTLPSPTLTPRDDWMYSRGGSGVTVGTMYVQTQAKNTQELVRDIGKYTLRERRGGK